MNTIVKPITAPAQTISKTVEKKDRFEIKKLADYCFRVYDHQEKAWVGNASESEGTCRQIMRNTIARTK